MKLYNDSIDKEIESKLKEVNIRMILTLFED